MAVDATPVEPITMVIFGATGDLSSRKLLPALYHLACEEYLPRGFTIVGAARRPLSDGAFQEFAQQAIRRAIGSDYDVMGWNAFAKAFRYVPVEFNNLEDYKRLAQVLHAIDNERGKCVPKLFYLAVAPQYYHTVFAHFKRSLLSTMCADPRSWTRVIIEKPFGSDLESAMNLNKELATVFTEDQIYRIDHYLGKETVQNILAFRFANGLFEPAWNREFIDHVQITVAESLGIEDRGEYYDSAGALRDMVQNHLLQILAHVAMEHPSSLSAKTVRERRTAVLRGLRPAEDASVARAQYDGCRSEEDVARDSTTETAVALKVMVGTPRWRGVPFYLRTGKRFPKRVSEVNIQFKPSHDGLFGAGAEDEINILTMRLQPEEGVSVRLNVKKPGHGNALSQVEMNFCYDELRKEKSLHEAYDTLLLNAMHGDQTLFTHIDEVEASWRFVTPLLTRWQKNRGGTLESYTPGTWGSPGFEKLMHRDKREWLALMLKVCDVHTQKNSS